MKRVFTFITSTLVLIALIFIAGTLFYGTRSIHQILGENKQLKESITNLTHEDQIGFAKVIAQEKRDDTIYTTLRFVETAREDLSQTVLQQEYEIEGDVIHFDALIVTFSDQAVMDGKARSLYLWRRIYGENMTPAQGYSIEQHGVQPERYADLLKKMRISDQQVFWEAIWDLANEPDKLKQYGIKAIYGNAIYKRLRPGLIYVFKIGADGQVYPETVLDM